MSRKITLLFLFCLLSFSMHAQPSALNSKVYTSADGVQGDNSHVRYTAWFDDNTLQVTGNFEANKSYEIIVYDMIGAKIFDRKFIANSDTQAFDPGRQVTPGIYIVSVIQENNASSREIIKIIKH